jgi:opacity protein-like surface antigen/outer membrane protease
MKKLLLCSIGLVAFAVAGAAGAADLSSGPPPPVAVLPVWTWTGGYVGAHLGALWGDTTFADPFGTSIFGDKVSTPGFLGGFQTGYNWQVPQTRLVLGIEADLSGLTSIGTNTCLAYSGLFLSANCRAEPNVSTTFTPRIGYAIDREQRTLAYIKGGFAAVHDRIDIASNLVGPPDETSTSVWKTGWTAGAGVERALSPAWSLRLEYDYLAFGRSNVSTPASYFQVIPDDIAGYAATPGGTASISQNVQEVKFGLDYRLGIDPWAHWASDASAAAVDDRSAASAWLPTAVPSLAGWEFEVGARYWYSSGKFQKDLGATTSGVTANVLVSRLTYDSVANSGEIFSRIESPDKIFIKGLVGTGALSSGHMNDEDWPGTAITYSNTISNPVKGTITYATGDIGYDVLRTANYSLGPFVGYNYYRDKQDAYGCAQIANAFSDCVPAIPNTELVITENDTWNSLRVGVNGDMMLLPGLRLNTDAAFLPYTQFDGTDIHWQRTDVANQYSPETGRGYGVQLDAILSYYMTPAFNVGVGGRYWAMWTTNNAYTNIFSTPCPCQTEPVKTDRYGLLVQADYKFDMPTTLAAK